MRKIILPLIVIAIAICGCKRDFDINQYATPPTDILPSLLLYSGLSETASNNANNYLGLTRWMGYWARRGDFPPDVQTETYDIKNNYTDSEWVRMYKNLSTYDLLEKTAKKLGSPFHIAAAKVMKAYCFSTLVDLYNDIPYKEAFEEATREHPAYDNAQDIYNDLVAQLDSAIIYFEKARSYYQNHTLGIAISDDQYDIMFGSAKSHASGYNERLTLWEKFTNTLELKLLVHQSQIGAQQSFIKDRINVINTARERKTAGFIGAGESATVNPGYQNSPGKMNPFYSIFFSGDTAWTSNWDYYTANTYAYRFYNSRDDERRAYLYSNSAVYFWPCSICGDTSYVTGFGADTLFLYHYTLGPVVGIYRGDTLQASDLDQPNFDGDPAADSSYFAARLLGIFKEPQSDQFIFSDFESLLLQAEAVQRGYISGNAQTLYESAIKSNFIFIVKSKDYPHSDGAIEAATRYISQAKPDIGWSASPDKLRAILTQKWIAMNGVNWIEAYNDYRRTGYPASDVLSISHAPVHLQPMIPLRFLYPQIELDKNSTHVPQLGTNAQFTSKVFWDD